MENVFAPNYALIRGVRVSFGMAVFDIGRPDLNPNYRPQTILSNTRVTTLILLESIRIEIVPRK